jgi:membrane-bound serine protease (ClpP class)
VDSGVKAKVVRGAGGEIFPDLPAQATRSATVGKVGGMKIMWPTVLILLSCGWLSASAFATAPQEPNLPARTSRTAQAAVIPCKGMIDDALFYSIKRRTEAARRFGADYLIYEIQTYGGMVDSADSIAKYLIQKAARRGHTVAYVTTEAISAGALISVSCQDVIMLENTTIGDCAPITLGGKLEGVEREKAESFVRAAFQRAAEANGYPALLLKAMVTMQTEVYRVRNLQTGQYEFFEGGKLPQDPNQYDVKGAEEIVGKDELLTLTAPQALEYGVTRAVVKDLDEALTFLGNRDGVRFSSAPMVLETSWSEQMVSWLNSPAVTAVLFMLALLGIYIEFSTPGFGLAGLVAVIAFAVLLGSRYLVGMANWVEIVLLFIGVALLLVEILILPGFGVAGILGIICMLAGLFGMLIRNAPDELPWPQTPSDWEMLIDNLGGFSLGFLAFIVLAWLWTKYLPRLPVVNRLVLTAPAGSPATRRPGTPAVAPERPVKIGQQGTSVTPLRPSGVARFGNKRLGVVSQGELIEADRQIVVVEIQGNSVVVKEAAGSKKTT